MRSISIRQAAEHILNGEHALSESARGSVQVARHVIDVGDHGGGRKLLGIGPRLRRATEAGLEVHLDELAAGSISVRERAARADPLPIDRFAGCGGNKVDAGDPVVAKRAQFAWIADAIVVGILPDHQPVEALIGLVDPAIAIAVQTGQRRHAARILPSGELRREHFRAVVDGAIAVHIERQDAVLALGPGHLVGGTVCIDVE